MEAVKISVRNLVEFAMLSGDISTGFIGRNRMIEGTKGHQEVQKFYGEGYTAEVPVSLTIERDGIILEVGGRIDGIIDKENKIIIHEIKTTNCSLSEIEEDYNMQYWAQVECYAYIYSRLNNMDEIDVVLSYYQMDTGEVKDFPRHYNIKKLEELFQRLTGSYIKWALLERKWHSLRDSTIRELQFPFQNYRNGQRRLAVAVYRTIKDGGKLFAQAPTGTGKTMAAVYPAIKALGEGLISKVFYLTAKTTTREASEKAVDMLRKNGLRLKTIVVTAKDKICMNPGVECSPEVCEFAKGHYDRVREALYDIFNLDNFTKPVIEEYALKYRVCPFEFSLDLSMLCDIVICDYNYVFDPRVSLKRYFMDGGDYVFLIDEAHNLIDRAREMYSAELKKRDILDLKRMSKGFAPKVYKSLNSINSFMIDLRKACDKSGDNIVQKEPPEEMYHLLKDFINEAEEYLNKNHGFSFREKLLEVYFNALTFLKVSEYYDDRYAAYIEEGSDGLRIKLFCLDPSENLKKALKKGKSSIYFSATLSPVDYYIKLLGGDDKSFRMRLPSPFPEENLCLLVDDGVATRYSKREMTYSRVVHSISSVIKGRKGNYLVFLPSYKYMNEIISRFEQYNPELEIMRQESGMSEEARQEFLNHFLSHGDRTLAGFAVMGGAFGEGIDLTGDRLCGAVIVGVGLPQVSFERDIIRQYFDELYGKGFEFAYIYPGMNRVMQAVGRVIRTENDRGVVMLIDERFSDSTYSRLFPQEWHPIRVHDVNTSDNIIRSFWNRKI